jgi:hypothetical protein
LSGIEKPPHFRQGHAHSDASREKISQAIKKLFSEGLLVPWNKGLHNFNLKEKNPMYGKKRPDLAQRNRIHPPCLGKHRPEEVKLKIGLANTGKHRSLEQRLKLSQIAHIRFTDKNNHPWLGRHHTAETKKKLSLQRSLNPTYPKGRFITLLGHGVRSSWEEIFCRTLHENNCKYAYESVSFPITFQDGSNHRYLPDIQLDEQTFIEIKGVVFDSTIQKLDSFKKQYPSIKLILVLSQRYVSKIPSSCYDFLFSAKNLEDVKSCANLIMTKYLKTELVPTKVLKLETLNPDGTPNYALQSGNVMTVLTAVEVQKMHPESSSEA